MKKIMISILTVLVCTVGFSNNVLDSTVVNLDEIVVSSLYSPSVVSNSVIEQKELVQSNYGQDPANYFVKMPSIISMNDNGTEFGYGYFRIRGLDQTRINVTLDGCPWNEAEDYGSYFINSPDLMSSMHSIKIDKGTSSSSNGIAGVAGGISLESVNLYKDTTSYVYLGGGSFNSLKSSVVYNMGNRNGWGLHIKLTHQQTDGFRDYGFNQSKAFTIKTGHKFNNSSIDVLSMNGYHRNGQGWIGNTLEELNNNPSANGNTKLETDNWFMSMNRLQIKHMFDNAILVSSLYYQYQNGSYRFDLDNYMKRMVGDNINSGSLYDYGLKHNMIGANIAMKHYFDKVDLSYGVNSYTYDRDHFMGSKCVNVAPEEYYDNTGIKDEVSVYSLVSYKPINTITISGNVQYRHVKFSYSDPNIYFNDIVWDFCNFGANVEYIPVRSVKIYGKFNQVNREPTRSDMFGGNESYTGELATINPEIASDTEFGIEYTNNKIYANINFYNMLFKNELILNGKYGLNGLPCHDNATSSYRRGIEMEFDWNFISKFNLRSSASYSNNRISTDTYGNKNHILTPDVTFDGDLCYNNNKFNLGLNANYRSSMYINLDNTKSIPYLFTLNAYGSYKHNDLELGIRYNNITNRINYNNGVIGANDKILYFRNAPTNFNVFVRYTL